MATTITSSSSGKKAAWTAEEQRKIVSNFQALGDEQTQFVQIKI